MTDMFSAQNADPLALIRGLPPYHPLALAEGWDPELVDKGVRSDAIQLVQAGYNVYGT